MYFIYLPAIEIKPFLFGTKMATWCSGNHKSPLLIFMLLLIFVVGRMQGVCIEDERKALLEIKASLHELAYRFNIGNLLATWVDHGVASGECCDWERIKCDKTTGYITHLSLGNILSLEFEVDEYYDKDPVPLWSLNFSHFLHFKELKSLDLSWNYIAKPIADIGLEPLSSLKKLELLNLSTNYIETNIFPSLGALTSLKILDLSYINSNEGYTTPPFYDISEFSIFENLEVLDLTQCGCYGTLQGSEAVSILKKLKVLNLRYNQFNESLITSLGGLSSLKSLDLYGNQLSGSFPAQELSNLANLEKLDLSCNKLNNTPSIQVCKSLMRMERLESVYLRACYDFNFNKSIISCISFLPSLKILDLSGSLQFGSSFPTQELSLLRKLKTLDLSSCGLQSHTLNELPNLPDLEVLILSMNNFNGTLPMAALASFHHLEVLDLEGNYFVGTIPSTIKALSSLKVVSFANNKLNGSLLDHGLCELKNLQELNLQGNMFTGKLPECFNMLSSLKFLDISSNQFIGTLPPSLIANLTSLEYVDFSHNKFEGSFSFSSFSNLKNLEVVGFISDNDKFEVETEEPRGWNAMFQLKGLALSNCNINMHKGSVVPSFLLHQHRLKKLDMSHNSMEGDIPTWLMKNNTMLEFLSLMNNSFGGVFSKPFYRNPNIRWLDMSGNLMKGAIPKDIQKFLPSITRLNLSGNHLEGGIPSLIGDLGELDILDLSQNRFSGEVPFGLFTNLTQLKVLKLSNNRFHGEVLSGNLSFGMLDILHLDSNYFSGKIGDNDDKMSTFFGPSLLDISNNSFTGSIPGWISNMSYVSELVVRNNRLGGQFPCGTNSFTFLDISQNHFSGSIPSCLVSESLKHLHLGSNAFTGSIPNSFCNLTNILTLDIGNNRLFGRIPKFLGELSNMRILLLGKNEFSGNIPKQLCQLTNASLLDLSGNFLSGSIPGCLQNINRPSYQAFTDVDQFSGAASGYNYRNPRNFWFSMIDHPFEVSGTQDEVLFTTKTLSYAYKGNVLDIMSGLDLSCNKLIGYIPEELGLLTRIHVLNLSHNKLTGPIPVNFSSLANIESLDLSFNSLSGNIPQELIMLNALAIFNVSYNNLSGRLPEMKAQFSTFNKESYKGNPLLCGLPLENECTIQSLLIQPINEERSHEKWYNMDMASFYGSFGSTWFVFILGFIALLYVNPHWKRRWLDFVEECMYTCYYFLCDLVWKTL